MCDLPEALADAPATLVCAPPMQGGGSGRCRALLDAADPTETVVWVTYNRSPAACVEQYRERGGDATAVVVAVGETAVGADDTLADAEVATVSTPADLTGLGIALSRALSSHDDVTCCFDSLTALLQYADRETAFEFLHAVTAQLYAADATAHVHLDPTVHDDRTVDALASLFNALVDVTGDTREVRVRESVTSD
ncbi:DUF7504 family protein [Haloarcula litorea]|uniref:DUF7504 family protein n=1 Tax=Haloarcula litorea TaxID=3032579 RepID=UPI0023E7F607|nr:hypothetical protein [Halomicroarcula sp. GDY20]